MQRLNEFNVLATGISDGKLLASLLRNDDFQAPKLYRRLGFEMAGRVDGYPRGHQCLTMVKRLASVPEHTSGPAR